MKLLGVRYDNLTVAEALLKALAFLETKRKSALFFLNADCLYKSKKDPDYAEILRKADLLLPDGIGVRLATAIAGGRMRENCNGTDFTPLLIEKAAGLGRTFFFMGSQEGAAKKAAEIAERRWPGLKVAGTSSGFFGNDREMVDAINRSQADILLVGMGSPLQEKWIMKNYDRLNVRMCVGVGALFDWLSGRLVRAPKVCQALHLEWLWRVLIDPGRLWKRYFVDDPQVLWLVFKDRFGRRRATREVLKKGGEGE
ncbi:MAG: hypothetical protein A3C47_06640 [Omnitrophica bacterium RIFCSPHIGHO2_02_FULL_51_18]|nr:MAG: hypothetical protein A3C47_06640 [Omnitrophica bacterium RIFCSPHIGHO2_02_FULL_51_18]